MLPTVLLEIDLGDDTAFAGHEILLMDLRRGESAVIVPSVRNNMKGGDPVSHCLIVAPFAVAWISDARVAV
jgi:hypothetical protein